MVLRGIFLATNKEINEYYPRLKNYFPKLYQDCIDLMPDSVTQLSDSVLNSLFNLNSEDEWKKYLIALDKLESTASVIKFEGDFDEYHNSDDYMNWLYTMYTIVYHYMVNSCFLKNKQLLYNISKIQDIPVTIIHGRYDMICSPLYAYMLHGHLPKSNLILTDNAGHSMKERTTEIELLKAMKEFETVKWEKKE